ncbi:MAG TPA: hypothetical protein VMI13_12920 [Solirubrobacteraceae bacterium]|nr:hypothetical protein [Solirubrobacteraceae bacterium]
MAKAFGRDTLLRAALLIGVLTGALSSWGGCAWATPKVTFKALPVPIPGFSHTGYILGAGAALEATYKISGTEYGGFPPPVIGINVYFPKGTTLHPQGFPTCAPAQLELVGPKACPVGSAAGPVGHATGVVAFGGTRVEENTTIESFYAPGGGIEFFTVGHSPTSLEILTQGHYVSTNSEGFGLKLMSEIPLISTVTGAPYAVVQSIQVKAGSARMVGGKPVYYGTIPKQCPASGFFSIKTEVIFDKEGAYPTVPEPVTVGFKAPCPRK